MSFLHDKVCAIVCLAVVTSCFNAIVRAEEPLPQEMISLPVKVVDEDGKPVAGVKLIPWRCALPKDMAVGLRRF